MTDLPYLSLGEVSGLIRSGKITSEALVRTLLERIGRLDGELHSFTLVMAESAIAEAKQADTEGRGGHWRGPLHGVPIGLKDIICVEGVPTTCGMEIHREGRAAEDATVVSRLRQAGAIIIGKLHLSEGALFDHHPGFPRPRNPWDPHYWPGASSSGAAVATAAGFCYGALGTDTGGSIRIPSAACGLTGLKPTWGRVSRHGVMPLTESLDHIGPLTRTVEDAALILQVIAGRDSNDATTVSDRVPDCLATIGEPLKGLSIGVDWHYATNDVDREVVEGFRNAVEVYKALGADIRDIRFPSTETLLNDVMPLSAAEAAFAHRATYPALADRYGAGLRQMLDAGRGVSAADVVNSMYAKARFKGALSKVFQDIDVVLTPTVPRMTPTWDDLEPAGDDAMELIKSVARFSLPFNITGGPALCMPSAFTQGGLPVSVQLAGPPLSEALLCRVGQAFQQATDFHKRHPALG